MTASSTPWLARKATEYIYRGCADLSDPDVRRHTALHNITALTGRVVSLVFGAVALTQGRLELGLVLVGAGLLMWLATLLHHRTNNPMFAAWLGVSAAGVLFLYMTATASNPSGHVWMPIFPLFPMFTLGRKRGTILTFVYLAAAAVVLFAPELLDIAPHPLALSLRLMVATSFTAIVAFYYEYTRENTHERMRVEVEVRRQAEAEVLRASAAKSDLLAAVSHEVRTPLTAIMGLHDLLLATDLDDKQRSYLDLAKRSGRSLIAIMTDLLDLSKVEAGKLQIEQVPFELHELTRALVDMQRVLATDRQLTVELEWDESMPRAVIGDPARVRQVLSNLVGNAVKYTPSGTVTVRVRRQTEGTALISVQDTGVGLSEEQQATVFEAFSQIEPNRGGSGLGLAIAKNLVEVMGGQIGVRSKVGEGSTFWFSLPYVRAEEGVVEVTPASGTLSFAARVLLVEDNALNRDVLRLMLERMGCTVDTATNGQEGVEAFAAGSYELVLMDCQMPVLDGYEATRKIREREQGRRTPIVAITAYALPDDLQRCIASGMDDHIAKPLMLEDVVATLGRWLEPSEAPAQ